MITQSNEVSMLWLYLHHHLAGNRGLCRDELVLCTDRGMAWVRVSSEQQNHRMGAPMATQAKAWAIHTGVCQVCEMALKC